MWRRHRGDRTRLGGDLAGEALVLALDVEADAVADRDGVVGASFLGQVLGELLDDLGHSQLVHIVAHLVPEMLLLPIAALPAVISGLKQGWAFAWRSLMAGELLVIIPGAIALGNRLAFAQEFGDAAGLLAYMIVILVIGMLADTGFAALGRRIRRRRGLAGR